MEFLVLLGLVDLMILVLILSGPFSIQGRKPYSCDFVKTKIPTKHFKFGLYSDVYRPVSIKLDLMRKTTELYIFISLWMMTLTLTFDLCCILFKVAWNNILNGWLCNEDDCEGVV